MKLGALKTALKSAHEKGFFYLLSTNYLTQALGFGTFLILAKLFTPAEVGQIKIIQSYTVIFTLLAGFGFNTAALRYCAIPESDQERAAIFRAALRFTLLASFASLALFWILCWWGFREAEEKRTWFLTYSFVIPLSSLAALMVSYLHANKQVKIMAGLQSALKAISFGFVLASSFAAGMAGYIAASVFGAFFVLAGLAVQVRMMISFRGEKLLPAGFVAMSLWSLAANGVGTVSGLADVFLLDRFMPDRSDIGFYSIATFFMTGAAQVTAAVQWMASPYFAERSGNSDWVRKSLFKSQGIAMMLSLPVAVAVYVGAWLVIHLYYGAGAYSRILDFLPVLLLRFIVDSSYALIAIALFGAGRIALNFLTGLAILVVSVAVGYWALPRFGTVGVAWGQVAGSLVGLMIQLTAARKILGGRP